MPAVACVLARFDRAQLGSAIEVMIALLDAQDGDPDEEEPDLEDSFSFSWIALGNSSGPGCPISDPGGTLNSEDEPDYWRANDDLGPGCPIADPDCGIDDMPCDDENDDREQDEPAFPSYRLDQSKGPMPLMPANDMRARKPHLDRIRATRCEQSPRGYWGMVGREYRLISEPLQVVFPALRRKRSKLLKQ